MSTLNIHLLCRRSIDFPELAIFVSRSGAMINLHWLELPMARTISMVPKVFEPLKFDSMCIDIVEIWFGIANGQISSKFYGVICPRYTHITP